MRFIDIFNLAIRNFKTRPMRTFLTILGIGVGIGAIVFLVSLGYGLQDLLVKQISSSDALLSIDIISPKPEVLIINKKIIEEIEEDPNVVEISRSCMLNGQITLENLTGDLLVYGVDPSYFRLGAITPMTGEIFDKPLNEIVISSAMIKLFSLEPGKIVNREAELTLFVPQKAAEEDSVPTKNINASLVDVHKFPQKFKIIGIIQDDTLTYIYMPLKLLESLNFDEFSQLKVKVKDNKAVEQTRDRVLNMGFLVSSLSDTVSEATKIFGVIQIVLAIFGLIALLVAAIGMFNTMTISLLERTNEIGIMKALGASNKDIASMFIVESVFMGFLGGVSGIFVGLISGKVFNLILNLIARGFGGQSVDIFYTPGWFVLVIIIFSVLVGFFTSLFPARRAASLNCLAALRYK